MLKVIDWVSCWALGDCYSTRTFKGAVFNFRRLLSDRTKPCFKCFNLWKKDCFHIEGTLFTILFPWLWEVHKCMGLSELLALFLTAICFVPVFWSWLVKEHHKRKISIFYEFLPSRIVLLIRIMFQWPLKFMCTNPVLGVRSYIHILVLNLHDGFSA